MKPDTMRRIDRWVGVPLCFCLNLLMTIASPFRTESAKPPKKVLFIELSEMGSVILADPAMRKLDAALDVTLFFLIFKSNAPSLSLLGTVPPANVRTLRDQNIFVLAIDTLSFFIWCWRERIDTVIDLELFSRFTSLLTALSGVRNKVGFHAFHENGLYKGNFLTHKVAYNPHLHITKNYISLVHALLAEKKEYPFSKIIISDDDLKLAKVHVEENEKEKVYVKVHLLYPDFQRTTHRIILINPNASDMLPQRRWPQQAFISVMRLVLEEFDDVLIIITGAKSEWEHTEYIRESVNNERCVNSAGVIEFEELVALYEISEVMLTNDSGPAHFSAVTNLRTFVLFGPETPICYGSLGNSTPIYAGLACSPCVSAANHRKTSCKDNQCLKVIEPERVHRMLSETLQEN